MGEPGAKPCLEHQPDVGVGVVRVPIESFPFRIGRSSRASLVLPSPRVSKMHAEIDRNGSSFVVRDLGSRNGTFVNGEAVRSERPLRVGDVLHLAHRELKLVMSQDWDEPSDDSTLAGDSSPGHEARVRGTRDLYRILTGRSVSAVFQAIVTLDEGTVLGFEALGRHTLESLDYDATTLFTIAHERGKADELSRIMRSVALLEAAGLPGRADRVFMNVHPDEMRRSDLVAQLEQASEALAPRRLVAEIHEAAIAGPRQMRALRAALDERSIEIAYDDFGAGRSRLMELAEVPPDFLKLDMSLIRDIDTSPARQELVAALVRVMRDAGIRVVAEGIETPGEHETCRSLGCELGQGFLIRHPVSVEDLRDTWQ